MERGFVLIPTDAAELAAAGVTLESAPCALCGTAGGTQVVVGRDRRHRTPGVFQVVRCETCGLIRTEPRPTRETIRRYYPSDYRAYRVEESSRRIPQIVDRRVSPMPPVAPPGRLLEIGPSIGDFLLQASDAGWQVTGVEFDEHAAAVAAARSGARVLVGAVEDVDFPPNSFEIICAWQVIEHLHDPVSVLRRCRQWLVPGGWLTIGVPDAGSWAFRVFGNTWFPLDLPRHLYHFSESTCRAMFEACGFVDIQAVRPRTVHDTLMSLSDLAETRGWIRTGRGEAIIGTIPARLFAAGVGLVAPALRLTGLLGMLGRNPA